MSRLMMKTSIIALLFNLLLIASANANHFQETILSFQTNFDENYEVEFRGMEINGKDNGVNFIETIDRDGSFEYMPKLTKPAFFNVYFRKKGSKQRFVTRLTIFVKPGMKLKIPFVYTEEEEGEGIIELNVENVNSAGNKVMLLYSIWSDQRMKTLWFNKPESHEIMPAVEKFYTKSEGLINKYNAQNEHVLNYMHIWSYNLYLSYLYRMIGKSSRQSIDLIKKPSAYLDNELALSFYRTTTNMLNYINRTIPRDEGQSWSEHMEAKINFLNRNFTNQSLKDEVIAGLIGRFTNSYTNNNSFKKDFKRLNELASSIGNAEKRSEVLNKFSNLKYTMKGANLPDITLKDIQGNPVKLHRFKGKYIYIDLWASWCGPCIKEIPSLNKLKEYFEDDNIAFLSISIDENVKDWHEKVEELNLKGKQFHMGKSKLPTILNINAIPHFVLYSPEGKLINYKASRPSNPKTRKTLKNLLTK